MWLENTMWNQYTDSMGVKFVHETKTKCHGQNISQRQYKMQ